MRKRLTHSINFHSKIKHPFFSFLILFFAGNSLGYVYSFRT